MKKIQRTITDLHYDLLRLIMLLVVKSSEGGAHLARAMTVCRDFLAFGDDKDVLRAANFDNMGLSNHSESYQCINGVINKCAQAGNVTAQYMLAKIILVTSSQLWNRTTDDEDSKSECAEKDATSSFMNHFMPGESSTCNRSARRLVHSELVRLFLCRWSFEDVLTMRQHLDNYLKYFVGSEEMGYLKFVDSINGMSSILRSVIDVGMKRKLWFSPRSKGVKSPKRQKDLNNLVIELGQKVFFYLVKHKEITYQRPIAEMQALSRSKLEEMKMECRDILEQVIPVELGVGKKEADAHLAERFFHYLAKHRLTCNGSGVQETGESSNLDLGRLKMECDVLGEKYESLKLNASSMFDDIFPRKDED